jgi:hypothetical protein
MDNPTNSESNPPETPVEQPTVEAAQPAPEEPKAPRRKYIRRAFGFMFQDEFIQGNFWDIGDGRLDIDGWCGNVEFDNTGHLVSLKGWSPEIVQQFTQKVQLYLK